MLPKSCCAVAISVVDVFYVHVRIKKYQNSEIKDAEANTHGHTQEFLNLKTKILARMLLLCLRT